MGFDETNNKIMHCSLCNFSETGLDRLAAHIRSHIKPEPMANLTSSLHKSNIKSPLPSQNILKNRHESSKQELINVVDTNTIQKICSLSPCIEVTDPRTLSNLDSNIGFDYPEFICPEIPRKAAISNSFSNNFPVSSVQVTSPYVSYSSQNNMMHDVSSMNSTVPTELYSTLTCGNLIPAVQNNFVLASSSLMPKPSIINQIPSDLSALPTSTLYEYIGNQSKKVVDTFSNLSCSPINNCSFSVPNNGTLLLNPSENFTTIVSSLNQLAGLLLIPLKNTKEVGIQTEQIEKTFVSKQLQVACVQTELKMGQISECEFNIEATAFAGFRSTEGLFECLTCGDDFVSKSLLQEHNFQQHTFICDKCDHMSTNTIDHVMHTNGCGKTELQMNCQDCKEVFLSLKKLNHHRIKLHKVRMPFRCGICNIPFELHSSVLEHISMHERSILEFKCRSCNKIFQTPEALSKHYTRHKSVKIVYECQFCMVSFDSNRLLFEHIAADHVISEITENKINSPLRSTFKDTCETISLESSPVKRNSKSSKKINLDTDIHICKNCCLTFKSQQLLVKHTVRCAKKKVGATVFSCDVCMEFFISNVRHKEHFKIHHKRLKGYRCNKCCRIFNTWALLKFHTKRLHTKIMCFDCSEIFTRMNALHKHKVEVHNKQISDTCEYKCSKCNSVLPTLSDLISHEKDEHLELPIPTTDELSNLLNPTCSTFSTQNTPIENLITPKSPIKQHLNDKDQLECQETKNLLPKTVFNKNTSQFICSICDKVTKSFTGLKSHYRRIHEIWFKEVNEKEEKIQTSPKVLEYKNQDKLLDTQLLVLEATKDCSSTSEPLLKNEDHTNKIPSKRIKRNVSANSSPYFKLIGAASTASSKNQCSDLVIQQHKCLKCNKLFSNYRGFSTHFRQTHKTNESVNVPSINTTGNSNSQCLLKKKVEAPHPNVSLDCPKCERTFDRNKALVTHLFSCHQISKKNHWEYWPDGIPKLPGSVLNCPKCQKKFNYKGVMVKHLYECHGVRPSSKKKLGPNKVKGLKNVSITSDNALRVVEDIKGPPACFICDRLFNNRRDLILHEFKVHGIRWIGRKRILPKKVRNLPKINEFVFPKNKKKRHLVKNEKADKQT